MVEDEDGFQIPTVASEVVVVEDAATDRAKLRIDQQQRKMEKGEDTRSIKQRLTATGAEEEEVGEDWRDVDADIEPHDDPSVNFEAPVRERVGGDELSIYLAFTPTDIKNLTTTHFKSYLVNDSNYYVHFSYALKQDEKWVLKAVGELEPKYETADRRLYTCRSKTICFMAVYSFMVIRKIRLLCSSQLVTFR